MRKILLTILVFFFSVSVSQAVNFIQTVASGECDYASSYDFGYNGDQSSGDIYGCLDGSAELGVESAGGIVTANGRTGNGVEANAADETLTFTPTSGDSGYQNVWNEVNGSISVKISASSGDNSFFGNYGDANNFLYLAFNSSSQMFFLLKKTGSNFLVTTTDFAITDGTWVTVEWNIDKDGSVCGGSEEFGARVDYWDGSTGGGDGDFDDANEGWYCESSGDSFNAMATIPTEFVVGDTPNGGINDTIYVDDVFIDFR